MVNPWGERTPLGQGEEWPVRVDRFLEEGVFEEEVDCLVQTASWHHVNGNRRPQRPLAGFARAVRRCVFGVSSLT
jgi:hypothetical protein